jgi:hypothetical protein
MNTHADQLKFRAWLVKQLTVSRWSAPLEMPLGKLAIELGVQRSVLEEAIALREGELKRRGKGGIVRGRRRYVGNDYTRVQVLMPRNVHVDWLLLCKALRVAPGTVFRSLIHHFLLDPKRPVVTSKTWLYRGETIPITGGLQLPARARVTRGAQVALDYHADLWNVSPTSLARGILTDFLEGRVKRLKIIGFGELWGDPDRYLHPEKFAK